MITIDPDSSAEDTVLKINRVENDKLATKYMKEKKRDIRLTDEKVVELYEQGYGILDIEKAEYLASFCDSMPEDILLVKGTNDKKSWDDVISELKIDAKTPVEKLGVPDNLKADLESRGFSAMKKHL